jgi:hypothetical protein
VPLPLPLAPLVIVIHDAPLDAVQLHPVATVTATVPVDAVAPTDALVGEIDGVQVRPACVTANVFAAIVSVPVRALVVGFAATL